MSTQYTPGTMLGAGGTVAKQTDKVPALLV